MQATKHASDQCTADNSKRKGTPSKNLIADAWAKLPMRTDLSGLDYKLLNSVNAEVIFDGSQVLGNGDPVNSEEPICTNRLVPTSEGLPDPERSRQF